jgi:modification methylase
LLEEGDGIVIDPFCGTGTTLVAAKLLGKKYIGIAISEGVCGVCKKKA